MWSYMFYSACVLSDYLNYVLNILYIHAQLRAASPYSTTAPSQIALTIRPQGIRLASSYPPQRLYSAVLVTKQSS